MKEFTNTYEENDTLDVFVCTLSSLLPISREDAHITPLNVKAFNRTNMAG